ncbi:MAG: ABC transporter permease [Bacilli bacterium]|nr:ABC transporter permease [Bacilli bacterium]
MKNKKLWYLTKQSLNRKIKSKWFVVVNILLVILIVGLLNIDSIIKTFGGDFNETTEVIVIDNTNKSYELLNESIKNTKSIFGDETKIELENYEQSLEDAKKEVEENDKLLIVLDNDDTNYMKATIISESYIDTILYQVIATSINSTKETIALSMSNIDVNELVSVTNPIEIERIFLDEEKNDASENLDMIMSTVFPILILPFFMLSIFLVQMIGAEVNDEKTTRGMEIIISNVSPKTHFFSKIIAGNLFVLIQGGILLLASIIGLFIRNLLGSNLLISSDIIDLSGIINLLNTSGLMDKLWIIIPLTLVLLLLSFIAYSLVAGILASMTTNIEDYQQIQTPIMIISLIGYYLSMMAPMFNGSIFIRIMSYIPFISCLLSPALLIMGQITIIDSIISIIMMVITIYLFIKYGLKIYKVGILNYSSSKLWTKMFKAIKEK